MLPGITAQQRQIFAQLINSPDAGCAAVLHWRATTKPVNYDPNDESSVAGATVQNMTLPFRCLFHQIDMLSGYQRFLEVQTGDVIIDYLADLALDGKEDARIEIGGKFYVQKTASKALLESWDVQNSGGGVSRVLFLTPAV